MKKITKIVLALMIFGAFAINSYAANHGIDNGSFEQVTGFRGKIYGIKLKDLNDRSPYWDLYFNIPQWNASRQGNVVYFKNNNHYVNVTSKLSQYFKTKKTGEYQIKYKHSINQNTKSDSKLYISVNNNVVDSLSKGSSSLNWSTKISQPFPLMKNSNSIIEISSSLKTENGINIDDIELVLSTGATKENNEETEENATLINDVISQNKPFVSKNVTFTPPWFVVKNKNNEPSVLVDINGNMFFPGTLDENSNNQFNTEIFVFGKNNVENKNLQVSQTGNISLSGRVFQNTTTFPNITNSIIIQNKSKETLALFDSKNGDVYIKGNYKIDPE